MFFALVITAQGENMFGESDPFWHVAAGDWIRSRHIIPRTFPWSYTAGDFHWLDVSWGWDILFSFLHAHWEWKSAIAMNGIICALMLTFVYAACLASCGSGIAAFLSTVAALTMIGDNLRPLQISNLLVAVWMFVLSGVARGRFSRRGLAVLPVTMLVWVNMHAGFIVGFVLLGAFFLQACWERDAELARDLCLAGVASLVADCINPYSIHVFDAIWTPVSTHDNYFISEWQPFSLTPANLLHNCYIVFFLLMAFGRKLPVLPVERYLSYIWLAMGLTSIRYLALFAIISAPVFSCRLQQWLLPKQAPSASALVLRAAALRLCSHRGTALTALLIALGVCCWLPGRSAACLFHENMARLPDIHEEMAFVRRYYPGARLLNSYNLGAFMEFETQGAVPVFMDSRAETAYPPRVLEDYIDFSPGKPRWQELLATYHVTGAIMENDLHGLIDSYARLPGWNLVFKGPSATIFMRQPPAESPL